LKRGNPAGVTAGIDESFTWQKKQHCQFSTMYDIHGGSVLPSRPEEHSKNKKRNDIA
jgi:hypothetical protein